MIYAQKNFKRYTNYVSQNTSIFDVNQWDQQIVAQEEYSFCTRVNEMVLQTSIIDTMWLIVWMPKKTADETETLYVSYKTVTSISSALIHCIVLWYTNTNAKLYTEFAMASTILHSMMTSLKILVTNISAIFKFGVSKYPNFRDTKYFNGMSC